MTSLRASRRKIAALYVQTNGVYSNQRGVDPWDKKRDARTYAGPWPVVAHPPCERWGRYWSGGPNAHARKTLGDDDGCFAAALAAVRKYGGVLEHPEASHAWERFELMRPDVCGGWVMADWDGGWTCCVAQGHYGHRAQKYTWLYAVGVDLPSLHWGRARGKLRLDVGMHSAEERKYHVRKGIAQRLSKKQRASTPIAFRDLLIGMARSVNLSARLAA